MPSSGQLWDVSLYLIICVCYSNQDTEEITKCQKTEGDKAAAMLLLMNIANRQEDWFSAFVHGLNKSGYQHISRKLNDRFEDAGKCTII